MSYYKASIIYSGDLLSTVPRVYHEDICSVCRNPMYYHEILVNTICDHVIHFACFKMWSANNTSANLPCTVCRTGLEDISRGVTRMSALESDSMSFVHPMIIRARRLFPALLAARNSFYLSLNRTSGYSLGQFTQRVIMPLFLEKHEFYPYDLSFYMSKLDGHYQSNLGIMPRYRNRNHWFQFVYDVIFAFEQIMIVISNWNYTEPQPIVVHILPGVVSELKNFWTGKRRTITEYEMSIIKCKELTKVVDTNVDVELLTNNLAPLIAIYDHASIFDQHLIDVDEVKNHIKNSMKLTLKFISILFMVWMFIGLIMYNIKHKPWRILLGYPIIPTPDERQW